MNRINKSLRMTREQRVIARRIAQLAAYGRSRKYIAERLGLTPDKVRNIQRHPEYKTEPRNNPAVKAKKPQPLSPKRAKLALEVARLALGGMSQPEIARALGVAEPTVRRVRRHPDYERAQERARAALRREAEHAAEVGRSEALEAARDVLALARANPEAVSPSDRMKAASLLTQASAPTPAVHYARARKELLASLPSTLRAEVVKALQGGDSDYLESLSDDEIAALLGEPS